MCFYFFCSDLSGNNLLCDCHMEWLPKRGSENQLSDGTRCYYPPQLRGALVSGLQQNNWVCGKQYFHFICINLIRVLNGNASGYKLSEINLILSE